MSVNSFNNSLYNKDSRRTRIQSGVYDLLFFYKKKVPSGLHFVDNITAVSPIASSIYNEIVFLASTSFYSLNLYVNKNRRCSFFFNAYQRQIKIYVDPFHKYFHVYQSEKTNFIRRTPIKMIFLHELVHARDFLRSKVSFENNLSLYAGLWTNPNEISAISEVNNIRRELGKPERVYHYVPDYTILEALKEGIFSPKVEHACLVFGLYRSLEKLNRAKDRFKQIEERNPAPFISSNAPTFDLNSSRVSDEEQSLHQYDDSLSEECAKPSKISVKLQPASEHLFDSEHEYDSSEEFPGDFNEEILMPGLQRHASNESINFPDADFPVSNIEEIDLGDEADIEDN